MGPQEEPKALIEIERDNVHQNQIKVISSSSNNKRYKLDENIRPMFVRYMASTYTCQDHRNTPETLQTQNTQEMIQPKNTQQTVQPFSTVQLHSQIAEELRVFMESIVAVLILDPTPLESEDLQSTMLQDMQMNHKTQDVRVTLQSTLHSMELFPEASPVDSLSTKFKKLDKLNDIATMSGKVQV